MSVSAIILAYREERWPNLPLIIAALLSGSVPPDEIIVWNNGAPFGPLVGAQVIQSHRNVGCKARFLAAMCAKGEYVLFHDDDLHVEYDTVRNLVSHAAENRVVSYQGRRLAPNKPYTAAYILDGSPSGKPELVDVSLGRLELVSRRTVNRLLSSIPFEDTTEMDDIWFSAAARDAGISCVVVPYCSGSGFVDLPDGGVGSCVGAGAAAHYAKRNALCEELFHVA